MEKDQEKIYDVIIIGGGPGGLTAGIYTSRSRLKTLLIDMGLLGGQMTTIDHIENFPGFPKGITGAELSSFMEEQAKRFGLETAYEEVIGLKLEGELKIAETNNSSFKAESIIISTGTEWRRLGIPGEENFIGKGVSFCATCDGAFFKDLPIVVVGGGDSALTEALYLTKFAKEVTIIHRRDTLRAAKIYQERAFSNPKIKFLLNSVVEEIKGDKIVHSIIVRNVKTNELKEYPTEGVFLFIGRTPRTQFLKGLIKTDEAGYILTNENCETSIKGIFAAGDCRKKLLYQISTAVGDGATAAFAAEKYLEEKRG